MSDCEEAEIMEIRGVVQDPGIYYNPAREVHTVDVYTGIELFQHLKLPSKGDVREIRSMLEESYRDKKRMTMEYLIKTKEIISVKYR